jgi:hypothetical protein
MNNSTKPYRCSTVSCGPASSVHLSAEVPAADSPASALCGASCSKTAPALLFLDRGCPACARSALSRGITVAGDWGGGVSLQRYAQAS